MSNFVFPFISLFPRVGFGDDGKLRMAVDGDAWQVVPDDLINCKDKGGKRTVSMSETFFYEPYME